MFKYCLKVFRLSVYFFPFLDKHMPSIMFIMPPPLIGGGIK